MSCVSGRRREVAITSHAAVRGVAGRGATVDFIADLQLNHAKMAVLVDWLHQILASFDGSEVPLSHRICFIFHGIQSPSRLNLPGYYYSRPWGATDTVDITDKKQ